MSTSKEEISSWFDRGVGEGASHMIVVCDTFDWEDYPVFTKSGDHAALRKEVASYDGPNMQKVMEVYDLRADKAPQLAKFRMRADLQATP